MNTFVRSNYRAKRFYSSLLFFLFIFFASGCARLAVKQIVKNDLTSTCLAGVSAERHSSSPVPLLMPLEEVARFKVSGSVSQHLCATSEVLIVPSLDGKLSFIDLTPPKNKSSRKKKKIVQKKKLANNHAGTIALAQRSLFVAMRFGKETLFRYDLQTGKQIWNIDAGDIASEPLIADSSVYVTAMYKHVDAYRVQDGKRRWQFRTESQLHASPALSQGILVAATDDGKVYGLEAVSGKKLWEYNCAEPVLATPAISQNRVYLGTAQESVLALSLQDGVLLWKTKTGAKIMHAPAVNDSLAIFSCGDGRVRAFANKTGTLRWTFRAGSVIGTSPLIAANNVFFGSLDHHFYALDAATGGLLWQQELDGRVRTDPVIAGDKLIVASEDRVVYVFGKAAATGTN